MDYETQFEPGDIVNILPEYRQWYWNHVPGGAWLFGDDMSGYEVLDILTIEGEQMVVIEKDTVGVQIRPRFIIKA